MPVVCIPLLGCNVTKYSHNYLCMSNYCIKTYDPVFTCSFHGHKHYVKLQMTSVNKGLMLKTDVLLFCMELNGE